MVKDIGLPSNFRFFFTNKNISSQRKQQRDPLVIKTFSLTKIFVPETKRRRTEIVFTHISKCISNISQKKIVGFLCGEKLLPFYFVSLYVFYGKIDYWNTEIMSVFKYFPHRQNSVDKSVITFEI